MLIVWLFGGLIDGLLDRLFGRLVGRVVGLLFDWLFGGLFDCRLISCCCVALLVCFVDCLVAWLNV